MTGRVCITTLTPYPGRKGEGRAYLLTAITGWRFGDNPRQDQAWESSAQFGCAATISGDAALLVDRHNVRGMTRGIQALDAPEDMRGALAARGLGQAEKFSAQAYQGRFAELYRPFT